MSTEITSPGPKLILGRRMTLVVAGIAAFLATSYLIAGLLLTKSEMEKEFQTDGEITAASLASSLMEAILSNNLSSIPDSLENARAANPNLVYAFISDLEGNPIAYTHNFQQGIPGDISRVIRGRWSPSLTKEGTRHWVLKTEKGEIYHLAFRLEGNPGGFLHLGFSMSQLDWKLKAMARRFIGFTLLGLLLSAIAGGLVYRGMSRPIILLINAVQRLGAGDLKTRIKVNERARDEVTLLSLAFNKMADQLQEKLTELMQSRLELSDEKIRIQAILDGMLHGVIFYYPDGTIGYWNKAAKDHWGWHSDQPPEYQEQIHGEALIAVEAINSVLSGETFTREFQIRRGDRTFHIIISAIRREEHPSLPPSLSLGPELLGVVELSSDITDQVNSSRALAHAEKLNVIGQLAAGVAHEINSPLDAALEAARILEKGELAPDQIQDFARAQRLALERIAAIIVRLLTFSRQAQSPKKIIPVWSVIHESVELIKYRLTKKNLTLQLPEPENIPFLVEGEALGLSQVIINLISNAIDASPEQGVIRIEVSKLPYQHDWIEISVTDQGKGIPLSAQERIFLPFFTTKEPGKGTGLGLAVSKNIIEQYGGRISFRNLEPPWGARFSIYLPLQGEKKMEKELHAQNQSYDREVVSNKKG